MNKTYFVDDLFSRFFYDDIFTSHIKKIGELEKHIASKEDVILLQIKDMTNKIIECENFIKSINDSIISMNSKIKNLRLNIDINKERSKTLTLNLSNDLPKVDFLAKEIEFQKKIQKFEENVINYNKDIIDYKKQICDYQTLVMNLERDFENIKLERASIKLFPINALKEAKKKINFLKDSTKLFKIEKTKKIFDKKENCNFSRV